MSLCLLAHLAGFLGQRLIGWEVFMVFSNCRSGRLDTAFSRASRCRAVPSNPALVDLMRVCASSLFLTLVMPAISGKGAVFDLAQCWKLRADFASRCPHTQWWVAILECLLEGGASCSSSCSNARCYRSCAASARDIFCIL